MMLTCMTALATINSCSPFELKSARLLRRDLRQFQAPLGGLDSNKLSQSVTKTHVHKALLTRLQDDSELFQSALLGSNTKISSAVLDSGASFTSITKENLHLVKPGSWSQLKRPIHLDGIAGGLVVAWKCKVQFETVNHKGDTILMKQRRTIMRTSHAC